ncbi:WD40 repeat domain-containing protein [Tautonia plasticadhaerens]|uniref:Translocation protein TolB n=1 Tax=Tautonia plasticadhaerens TaxID=2527974 RepID=A0A518HEV8_9BACT|nr:WD40 repeat domain-containing protein [Tautonia plasticadhaerens]QDV39368.1 translocation protein TolB [Tautonia plasticadhaerens]
MEILYALALSPDGRRVAVARDDKTVQVVDLATGRTFLTLRGSTGNVFGVKFSPDGTLLATTSAPREVKVWDAASGQERFSLNIPSRHLSFSPDSQRLATNIGDTARIWDVATGQVRLALKGLAGGVESVAFTADGTRIATTGNGTVELWDAATGQELVSLKGHSGVIWAAAFSPDGERIATASADGTVRLWDTFTGQELLTFRGHAGPVTGVAFNRDGSWIASTGWDDSVMVWEVLGSAVLTPLERRSQMEKRWASWQRREAEVCERKKQWFAAVWHLNQLLARTPDDTALRARRDAAQARLDDEERRRQSQTPASALPEDVFAKYRSLLRMASSLLLRFTDSISL